MWMRCNPSLVRVGSTLALMLVLAGCTKGGQFDPTTLLDNDMFGSKKKLQGQREPVFPNGVPGTSTGVPPELIKGYQPPPDQAADNGDAAAAAAAAAAAPAAEAAKPKPKLRPKPKLKRKPKSKLARAPASPPRTHISVGLVRRPAARGQQQAQPSQSIWPGPPSTAPAQNTAQPSQSIWPASPPTGPVEQTAQPSQSIWPNPPAPGTSSQ
jgi:hypothetical protein